MKKYYLIYQQIRSKILSGEYRSGQKLPSKRVLADMNGCSLITVQRAYAMLEDEGYLFTHERRGYFVAPIEASGLRSEENRTHRYLPEPTCSQRQDFEYSVWFQTARKVLSEKRELLLEKAPNKGCAVLRNAIADYLYRYRGMFAQPEDIIIGSGAEQLYQSVVQILGRERIYGIEDPCYEQICRVYQSEGAELCYLKMGTDGIETVELQKHFGVLHVTPFHSYPSGVTTSIAKRYEYLKWAQQNDSYIVEDDFDSEFFIPMHPIESLYALSGDQRVIYINTFSKSISPSMRIGYMILPQSLRKTYEQALGEFSCSVPVMDQYILAEFLANGSFERHLNRMRKKLKNMQKTLDNKQMLW
ncbi:MAG: PLP-dependent aminotransferase family protein [Ruminococcaceae bacterium]|nr:PLP-dependent aminotransferase family protein [Oscillospiraceae bacterium]